MNLERPLRAWRAKLLRAGLDQSVIDELEAHVLDAVEAQLPLREPEAALAVALHNLGDPVQAFRRRLPPLPNLDWVRRYAYFLGAAVVANELLLLGNGRFDLPAVALGLALAYGAHRIRWADRWWLRAWLVAFSLLLGTLLLAAIAALLLLLQTGTPAVVGVLVVTSAAAVVTALQIPPLVRSGWR